MFEEKMEKQKKQAYLQMLGGFMSGLLFAGWSGIMFSDTNIIHSSVIYIRMAPVGLLVFAFVCILIMLHGMGLQSLSMRGILSPIFEDKSYSNSETRSYDDDKMTPDL